MSDDEQIVYVSPGGSRVYHSDPNCHSILTEGRERRLSVMRAWGYSECQYCGGVRVEGDTTQTGGEASD